jgi:hypothetical protein
MAAGDIKQVRSSVTSMTVTNLNSLANSATAGWQSAVVDNTSNLYVDAQVNVVLDFANTSPANSKAFFVYAYGGLESGVYTNPASGSEGTITLTDVTANPQCLKLLASVPYTTADEVVESGPISVAQAFGGTLPAYWGIVIINHTGAAIAASGNSVKWCGIYHNVASA